MSQAEFVHDDYDCKLVKKALETQALGVDQQQGNIGSRKLQRFDFKRRRPLCPQAATKQDLSDELKNELKNSKPRGERDL